MIRAAAIFDFLRAAADRGEHTVLITLTAVIGSSSRAPGTHMAVSETGAFAGSFSGGCVEAAVVAEAKRIMMDGRAELIRFGAGSRYIDIRLPCGGGIDLLFTPHPSRLAINEAAAALAARRSVSLSLGMDGSIGVTTFMQDMPSWRGDVFHLRHDPDLRLVIIGHGAETLALARLATAHGAAVTVLSPDRTICDALGYLRIDAQLLVTPARSLHLASDAYTAIVFLFHDHDWETDLIAQALEQDAFFVGAMGSRATNKRRQGRLAEIGLSAEAIARVVGPIGLIPATRDPDTLALSVLGQVVDCHGRASLSFNAEQRHIWPKMNAS